MIFLAAQGSANVDLFRGAPIGAPGYWAVEDAYLDKAEPGVDHGGGFTLLGGDGRTVLLRFGDLRRAVGPGRRVVAATLVLTPSGGDVPKLSGVTSVDAAWGEGPQTTLTRILARVEAGPKGAKAVTARGATTWNERRAGIAPWPAPGAPGGAKVEASLVPKGRTVEISGLGSVVQGWVDRPWTDHGLALGFGGDVEFFSSQSPSGRPRLVLTTAPATALDDRDDFAVASLSKEDGRWTARVRHSGASSAPVRGRWWVDGKSLPEASVPVGGAVFYAGSEPKDDAQVPSLGFEITTPDSDSADDRLDVFPGGKAVTLRLKAGLDPQAVVAYWNETVAPQSRFSFAPEGVRGRVRLERAEVTPDGAATLVEALRQIGTQLGLPHPTGGGEDLYPGLMGYGDTRFEGTIPGTLALPYEPYPNAPTETALLEPTGLLSATDVGRLNEGSDRLPLPKVAILTITDLVGRPLPGLEVTLSGAGQPTTKLTTNPSGSLVLPPTIGFRSDLSNGTLTVRAAQSGTTATGTVKAWRLSDAVRRSGSPVVVSEVRLDLPMLPLETGTNLADGKAATDSAGKPYAYGSPLSTEAGSWVEIDLGRDRTIGEIALRPGSDFWERFEVRVYSTGQKPEDAGLWAGELASGWTRRNRAEEGWMVYRAPTERIRFVRIVSRTGGPASLAGLRVVPVRIVAPTTP